MKKILFLCTGNSCRSQMAHGFANQLLAEHFSCYSAGIESHGLNPYAVAVMQESGVDISHHQSQTLTEFDGVDFDYVFAVCDHAAQNCPVFSQKTQVIQHQFDDPPKLAKNIQNNEEKLHVYRKVRDEIKGWISELPNDLPHYVNDSFKQQEKSRC